jgi:hypothetical protein
VNRGYHGSNVNTGSTSATLALNTIYFNVVLRISSVNFSAATDYNRNEFIRFRDYFHFSLFNVWVCATISYRNLFKCVQSS